MVPARLWPCSPGNVLASLLWRRRRSLEPTNWSIGWTYELARNRREPSSRSFGAGAIYGTAHHIFEPLLFPGPFRDQPDSHRSISLFGRLRDRRARRYKPTAL